MFTLNQSSYSLTGQVLVAMPHMKDPRFSRSVILVCGHDENGAMGLAINHPAEGLRLRELLVQLELSVPTDVSDSCVLQGGPVEIGRGFVLHSSDYQDDSTLHICEGVSLTATTRILQSVAENKGPQHALVILGYAGWSAGQLEQEIASNDWLQFDADLNVIFEVPFEKKWRHVLAEAGIDPALLPSSMGHS